MDPQSLIDTTVVPGLPIPFWLIEVFKVAGFALHMVPMNLWFAGLAVAMILYARGNEQGKRWSSRLLGQMPVIVATGVNLGIVPLLFIQVAYAKLFYPATILMAWFWLSIVVLLIPAYYGVYLYAFGLADGGKGMTPTKRAVGWLSALLFVAISFIFVNAMSLLTNVKDWPALWERQNVGGAVLGTRLNLGDPTLWPRWLMVFGIALTTAAAWVAFDAAWFGRKESPEYKTWARGFAWKLYSVGLAWFAVMGSWYVLGTWREDVYEAMFSGPRLGHTLLTALSPGLPWLLLAYVHLKNKEITRPLASLIGLTQFGVILINAVSRQMVQNLELGTYFKVAEQPVDSQWGQLGLFLATVVVGAALVVWMIIQANNAPPVPEPANSRRR
jgi:hypothetical protein